METFPWQAAPATRNRPCGVTGQSFRICSELLRQGPAIPGNRSRLSIFGTETYLFWQGRHSIVSMEQISLSFEKSKCIRDKSKWAGFG